MSSRTRRRSWCSFADATIEPEAAIGIAPEKPGAVSLVTAFQQPDAKPARGARGRAARAGPRARRAPRGHDADPRLRERGSGRRRCRSWRPRASRRAAEAERPRRGARLGRTARPSRRSAASSPARGARPDGDGIEVLEEGGMLEGKEYTGRRISLDFKEVEIADVLRLIAEVSDLNIIAGDEVQGQGHDPPGGRALGPGARRDPADQGPRLRRAWATCSASRPADVLKAEEEARLQERRAKEKLEDLVVKLQPVNYAQRQGRRQDGEASCSPRAAPSTSTTAPTR